MAHAKPTNFIKRSLTFFFPKEITDSGCFPVENFHSHYLLIKL